MGIIYQTPLTGRKLYNVSIVGVGFQNHWHSEIELMYCLSGQFRVTINNSVHTVRAGDAVFVSSIDTHGIIASDAKYLVIEIGYSLLGDSFGRLAARRFVHPVVSIDLPGILPDSVRISLKNIFDSVISCGNEWYSEWQKRAKLYELAALISTVIPTERADSDDRGEKLAKLRRIQSVFAYVETNYASNITLDEIAAVAGYEKRSFCRVFRSVTGETFHRYLNAYRVETACLLLDSENISIGEAGEQVGFTQAKTFSRVFKSLKGISPSHFRGEIKGR